MKRNDIAAILAFVFLGILAGACFGFTAGRMSIPEKKCDCREIKIAPKQKIPDKQTTREISEFNKKFLEVYGEDF